MKRGLIIAILGLMLIISVSFSIAEVSDDYQLNPSGISSSVSLEKGWNLVSIYAISWDDDNSNFEGKNILAAFFYDKYYQRYIQIYPNREEQKFNEFITRMGDPEEGGDIKEYGAFTNSAMWIYSEKSQTLNFKTLDGPFYLDYVNLKSGWNLLAITPEMIGKSLNDMKGNCNIKKAAIWYSGVVSWSEKKQEWVIQSDSKMGEDLDDEMLWSGFAINVTNDCTLSRNAVYNFSRVPEIITAVCTIDAPFMCGDEYKIESEKITLDIRNIADESMDINSINIDGCTPDTTPRTVAGGEVVTAILTCDLPVGNNFEGNIIITYKKSSETLTLTAAGAIFGKVS